MNNYEAGSRVHIAGGYLCPGYSGKVLTTVEESCGNEYTVIELDSHRGVVAIEFRYVELEDAKEV